MHDPQKMWPQHVGVISQMCPRQMLHRSPARNFSHASLLATDITAVESTPLGSDTLEALARLELDWYLAGLARRCPPDDFELVVSVLAFGWCALLVTVTLGSPQSLSDDMVKSTVGGSDWESVEALRLISSRSTATGWRQRVLAAGSPLVVDRSRCP